MTSVDHALLIRALRNECDFARLSPADWDKLIRLARHADLLGRIAEQALQQTPSDNIPAAALAHLRAEQVLLAAQRASVEREVAFLERALADLGLPVILLKGAAYLIARLPAALGRTFSDIDILLPRAALAQAESALVLAGWQTTHLNAYDQRYYREWMHELPPMQHIRRQSVLDVHHTILPLTARLRPDARQLLDAAQPLPDSALLHTLSPPDMVLHSMTHLFYNEEFSHGLRDLSDLDRLLRHFAALPAFHADLLERAQLLQLGRPLFYGLRYVQQILGTPLPPELIKAAERWAPPPLLLPLMDALWQAVLRSPHPQTEPCGAPIARFMLYVRSHWQKMPFWRLIPHLLHKAWRQGEKRP